MARSLPYGGRAADQDGRCGLSRYRYEPVPAVSAFIGYCFDHREWPVRKALEKHNIIWSVADHEEKCMNAAGYWFALHQAALDLR